METEIHPLVSICIPMYNAETTIKKTLTTIINQTYKNIEIIIVDNCSSDTSIDIVQEFPDPRIKLIRMDTHLPTAELNWNRCFQYTNGEYIALFHADDIYLPDMVSRQIETFRKYPLIGGVFTQGNIINEKDERIGEFKIPLEIKSDKPYDYQELFNAFLKHADFLPTPTAMICKDMYRGCAPFRSDQFSSASDFDMWLRIAAHKPLVILDEKLINYRISKQQGSNVLHALNTEESDFFKVMDSHIRNTNRKDISGEAMDSYDLSRFGDQMRRAYNAFRKRDWACFIRVLTSVRWLHNIMIILTHPQLVYEKYQMLKYFRVFQAG